MAPATQAGLREIGDLRLVLECHALDLSFAAGDLEWEGRVVAAHHKLAAIERQLLEGNRQRTPEWIAYDWAFHNALISACGSRLLMKTHGSVFDRFLRYHMLAASFRGPAVSKDHEALFKLAMARDAEGAEVAARRARQSRHRPCALDRAVPLRSASRRRLEVIDHRFAVGAMPVKSSNAFTA